MRIWSPEALISAFGCAIVFSDILRRSLHDSTSGNTADSGNSLTSTDITERSASSCGRSAMELRNISESESEFPVAVGNVFLPQAENKDGDPVLIIDGVKFSGCLISSDEMNLTFENDIFLLPEFQPLLPEHLESTEERQSSGNVMAVADNVGQSKEVLNFRRKVATYGTCKTKIQTELYKWASFFKFNLCCLYDAFW